MEPVETKFSKELLNSAVHLIRTANREMGELGSQKARAMLDAFDPDLYDEVMYLLLIGNQLGNVVLKYDPTHPKPNLIDAVRALRNSFGFSLKRSKVLAESALQNESVVISVDEDVTHELLNKISTMLEDTGWSIEQ